MATLKLPASLQGIFFDFVWDKAQVWALPTVEEFMTFTDLAWHLELPVWSTVMGEPRFDLQPAAVLAYPERYSAHWLRIQNADLGYPLELFRNGSRWVILDGYHRLARYALLHLSEVRVRRHSDDYLGQIGLM